MPDTYKLQYNGNTLTYPGTSGSIGYDMPGTYYDTLWTVDVNNPDSRFSGNLSKSIYDYDMIKIFPWHNSLNEMTIATMQSPKDIPWGTSGDVANHIFTVGGQGNIYLVDQVLNWSNSGKTFSAFPINANSASIRCTGNTVSGTTAKNWAYFNTYNRSHCGIGKIIGVKYYQNRDLLYSADLSTGTWTDQVCELARPYSAYQRLQVHLGRPGTTGKTNWENGGTWSEWYNWDDKPKGIRPTYLCGGGGGCYLGHKAYKFTSPTQLSGGPAKCFLWNIGSTGTAPRASTAYSGTHAIQEIWGIKDA